MTYSNTVESAQGSTSSGGAATLRDGSTYYDTASSRVQQGQRIDVTDQIRQYHQLYGGSDNTQASGVAASQSLNYAPSPTLQQAQVVSTTVYPFTFKLAGQVGLQGAENYYVRVEVNLITPIDAEFEEDGWEPADVEYGSATTVNTYESEVIDFDKDTQAIFNAYEPAIFTNPTPEFWDPLVSVDLNNIGVGNIYIDNWLDTMLYTRDKKMWGYDKMYIRPKDHFYIGVHARNTRQLPYNIEVTIGTEFVDSTDLVVDKSLIAYSNI
tara:strand:+ start:7 stop:807 length:801 start_codon:yes stop_codon:yes gene_type:complete